MTDTPITQQAEALAAIGASSAKGWLSPEAEALAGRLSAELRDDLDVATALLKQFGAYPAEPAARVYGQFSDAVRANPDFAFALVESDPRNLWLVAPTLRNDPAFVGDMVSRLREYSARKLDYGLMGPAVLADAQVARQALQTNNPDHFAHFSDSVKDDPTVGLAAVEAHPPLFEQLSERLRNDARLAEIGLGLVNSETARTWGVAHPRSVGPALADDRAFAYRMVSERRLQAFEHISPRLQQDDELARLGIPNLPRDRVAPVFAAASEALRRDKEFVRALVRRHPAAATELLAASPLDLEGDKSLWVAVASDSGYGHVPERFQRDVDVARAALQWGHPIHLMHGEVLRNESLMRDAIEQDPANVRAITTERVYTESLDPPGVPLAANREFMAWATSKAAFALEHAAPSLLQDREFVLEHIAAWPIAYRTLVAQESPLALDREVIQQAMNSPRAPCLRVRDLPEAVRDDFRWMQHQAAGPRSSDTDDAHWAAASPRLHRLLGTGRRHQRAAFELGLLSASHSFQTHFLERHAPASVLERIDALPMHQALAARGMLVDAILEHHPGRQLETEKAFTRHVPLDAVLQQATQIRGWRQAEPYLTQDMRWPAFRASQQGLVLSRELLEDMQVFGRHEISLASLEQVRQPETAWTSDSRQAAERLRRAAHELGLGPAPAYRPTEPAEIKAFLASDQGTALQARIAAVAAVATPEGLGTVNPFRGFQRSAYEQLCAQYDVSPYVPRAEHPADVANRVAAYNISSLFGRDLAKAARFIDEHPANTGRMTEVPLTPDTQEALKRLAAEYGRRIPTAALRAVPGLPVGRVAQVEGLAIRGELTRDSCPAALPALVSKARAIHDAGQFKVPTDGQWNREGWAALAARQPEAARFAPQFAKYEARYGQVAGSLAELKTGALLMGYGHHVTEERRPTAEMCARLELGAHVFARVCEHLPRAKPEAWLPDVALQGQGQLEGYRLRLLEPGDPKALVIGASALSSCCQQIDGAGEAAAIHSFVQPSSGVYVVEDRKGELIAQSWTWMDKDRRTLVFDSIESKFKDSEHIEKAQALFRELAVELHLEGYRTMVSGTDYGMTRDVAQSMGLDPMDKQVVPKIHTHCDYMDCRPGSRAYSTERIVKSELLWRTYETSRVGRDIDRLPELPLIDWDPTDTAERRTHEHRDGFKTQIHFGLADERVIMRVNTSNGTQTLLDETRAFDIAANPAWTPGEQVDALVRAAVEVAEHRVNLPAQDRDALARTFTPPNQAQEGAALVAIGRTPDGALLLKAPESAVAQLQSDLGARRVALPGERAAVVAVTLDKIQAAQLNVVDAKGRALDFSAPPKAKAAASRHSDDVER